jgi:transposase
MADTQVEVLDEWTLTRPIPEEAKKLTPQRVKTILANIAAGGYILQSCIAAGVSARQYRRWLKRGEAEPDSVYAEFAELAERAQAIAEARLVRYVQVAAEDPKNWAAAMTLLERRHPERWGRRDRVHSTVDAVHTLKVVFGDVPQGAIDVDREDADIT